MTVELDLHKRERARVAELIEEIGIAAAFHANAYGHQFVVEPWSSVSSSMRIHRSWRRRSDVGQFDTDQLEGWHMESPVA
jgi:hypothetical protein